MDTEARVERRKHQRFKMPCDVYSVSRDGVACVLEMSTGGFSAQFIDSNCSSEKLCSAAIFSRFTKCLADLPIQFVWVNRLEPSPFSSTTTQKCGVQFVQLEEEKKAAIEKFIRQHRIMY